MDYIYRSLVALVLLLSVPALWAADYAAKLRFTHSSSGTAEHLSAASYVPGHCQSLSGGGYSYDGTYYLLFEGAGPQVAEATQDGNYLVVCKRVWSGNGGVEYAQGGTWTAVAYCPNGGTLSADKKMCLGAPEPPPPPCSAGNIVSSGLFDHGGDPAVFPSSSRLTCYGGCEARFQGSYPVARALVQGKYRYFGRGDYETTGGQCTAGAPQGKPGLTDVPPSSCGAGQVLGQFNGKDLCLDGGTGEPTNPNETPTPKTDTTTTTTTNNPDGSTTKTETTTHSDGSQTVVRTTTFPDGSTNQSKEEKPAPDEDPQKTFCEENPDAALCKKSDFGGGCGSFMCKGDAVQCAIAIEQHKRNCELWTPTALSDLGDQVATGADPEASQHPALASNRQVFNLGNSINTSKQYAGSCPADRSITVMGQTIAIPLSSLCPYLEMFGNVMIALALLGAARTVGVF